MINDLNPDAAKRTAALIAESGGEAHASPGDVTSSADVRKMVATASLQSVATADSPWAVSQEPSLASVVVPATVPKPS